MSLMEHLTTVCTLTCKCQWCKPNAQCTCKCLIILSRLTFVKYRDDVVWQPGSCACKLLIIVSWLTFHQRQGWGCFWQPGSYACKLLLITLSWLTFHQRQGRGCFWQPGSSSCHCWTCLAGGTFWRRGRLDCHCHTGGGSYKQVTWSVLPWNTSSQIIPTTIQI